MNRYPLVSALSRPLIVTHLARVAREHGADAVAHGCTGKGNDQVRFEVGMASLAPEVTVLAPVRDSGMTRDKAIAFAEEKGLPINVTPGRRTRSTRTCGGAAARPVTWRTSGRRRTTTSGATPRIRACRGTPTSS